MGMKPSLLPLFERQTRKALELKSRGLDLAAIAAAMGLREEQARELLRRASPPKPEAKPPAKA
jgi:orotate phosphoribosyltransferase-like protein